METRYKVKGKGIPSSVNFTHKSSAMKYAEHYYKKGKKPFIHKVSTSKY